ncbi:MULTISPECIES: pyridoxal phosphate-dependent decarboxylase family protein [Streptomyces]|uniref:Aspartate aminotransferase family protein n=1 Tax=Streptomyces spororaveus TaxID=284039 RepID=A0ABQ3T409_9ACTN|nr:MULTISPECIES: pyridoxal-dependent decarboxylase [Streptomyces]MCM9077071.1 pyridoxal-dependent decarboxylase [Streptomyces spororaveus]MCX5308274.1 pyridoxal-dependent decarboxylase [Streptomyces sp. NBC_00160]GHI75099.1 aspartate aminotransferase family protein [Streptomyces spororaveus]
MDEREAALRQAHGHAVRWLASLSDRPVPARATVDEIVRALGAELPDAPSTPADVVDLLATACEPGLTAFPSGRFYGFVVGGTEPAALAADWLVSAWDQNSVMRAVSPAYAAAEEIAGAWLLDLLGLPPESSVGFTTGATMANFTCLAAGRDAVLRRNGWNVAHEGLAGGPPVRVIAGQDRHMAIDLALRYLGLGRPELVAADDQGRMDPEALSRTLAAAHPGSRPGPEPGPTIVILQAGDIHSGAFDPFAETIRAAREADAWVHVDGAFGLWAAASPAHAHLAEGCAQADSWATDAHKTLNVPYDCGLAVVRDSSALRSAMGLRGDYLIQHEHGDPVDKVPELSRRGRAFTVWAALRSLGRQGVADLVDRLCHHARTFATGIRAIDGATVLNDVVFTQVCADFGGDDRTDRVLARLLDEGTAWISGSTWHGRRVMRISVSNWSTTDEDVSRTLDAIRRAASKAFRP